MKLELETTIEIPSLPNFIKATSYPAQEHAIDVADFKDEQLKKIGEDWTAALILHAQTRRKNRELAH